MIVVKVSDGLGNQMFQYALGRSIALKKGKILKLDTAPFNKNYKLRNYLLEKFNIEHSKFSFLQKILYNNIYRYIRYAINKIHIIKLLFPNLYIEKKAYEFDKNIFDVNSSYFSGYWQDFRYFNDIRQNLLREFTLKEKPNDKNQNMLQKIKNTNSVSVHVRRGDYLSIKGQEVCTLEYYEKAIELIVDKVDGSVFFIFSDDIDWVKKNIKINKVVNYVDFNDASPERDMELMRNCKHNIIANSTFSWWGAWLNDNEDKIVILPKEWKKDFLTPAGFIAENWILI